MTSKRINAARPRNMAVHLTMILALIAVCGAPLAASAVQPAAQSAQNAVGCCVCRGTKNGEKTSLKSCSDGATGQSCLTKCRGENAGSFVFGYAQTCSQGCSGFPTQK